jgi:hypothetical protein
VSKRVEKEGKALGVDTIRGSRFVSELMRLSNERMKATNPDDKQSWEDEMAHLLRMNSAGRLDEYFASRSPEPRGEQP